MNAQLPPSNPETTARAAKPAPVAPAPKARRGQGWFLALAAGAGAVAGMGHPPFSALYLALPALAVVFYVFRKAKTAKAAALRLWAAGLGYFGLSLAWIVNPFFVDPLRHGWMAPFALVLMAGGLALFWGLAGGVAHRLGATKASRALALAALLTLAEMSRAFVFTGFPWATLGHVFIGWAPMQLASLGGAGLLTLIALLIAASWGGAVAARRPQKALGGALVLALAFGFGLWRKADTAAPASTGIVRLVQPAIPQSLKWDADQAEITYNSLLALSAAAPGPLGPPDVTIWPETSFPYFLDGSEPLLAQVKSAVPGQLFIGAPRSHWTGEVEGVSNSFAEIGQDGAPLQIYDKHHLVPFGEYVPFAELLGALGLRAMVEQGSFTPGPGPELMAMGALGQALPLICYEAIFPGDILSAPARPDLLLQVTNDAWFGTLQGPYQHLAQARLRAVETGLPFLRAANTGVSALIDPQGRVLAQLALGERGTLDVALPPPAAVTAYWKYGDLPIWMICAALAGLATLRRKAAKVD